MRKPKGDPGVVAKAFVDAVSKIPEVVEVWGYVDGVTLHLQTLFETEKGFEEELETHKRIIGTERPAREADWEVRVEFHASPETPDWNWLPDNAVSLYRRR